MISPLRFWNTKKLIVISSPKVASSFLDNTFYKDYESTIQNIFLFNNDLSITYTVPVEEVDRIDFEKIFTNTNKKDILILYRNPKEKFLSGIIQDFIPTLIDSTYQIDYIIYNYFKQHNLDVSEFLNNSNLQNKIHIKNINENEKFQYYFKHLLKLYYEYIIENNKLTVHTNPTLLTIYAFINDKIKDKNKIHLIDIDNVSDDFLKNYLEDKYELYTVKTQDKNTQKPLKNILIDVIKEFKLENKLENFLKDEMFIYKLIKNLKQNIT